MDFIADLRKIVIENLKALRASCDETLDTQRLCMQYLETVNRFFPPRRKYKVLISKELEGKISGLPDESIRVLSELKVRFENGVSVAQYFSDYIRQPKKADKLLKYWRIWHAHIDEAVGENRRSKRSKLLLIFTCDAECIYFIDVIEHPKGNSWFQRAWLETIHDNWPELLNVYNGATDIVPKSLSDAEARRIMNRNYLFFIKVRDVVVVPNTLGVATDGTSADAIRETDYIVMNLKEWENHLMENEKTIQKQIEEQLGIVMPHPLDYELIIENDKWVAYEKSTKTKIEMF